MKKQLLLLLIFSISLYVQGQNIHKLASPDGNIQISVNLSDKIYYDVICRNETLLKQCHLAMEIGDQELGTNPKMTKVSHKNIDESLKPVIPLKFSSVSNRYNQLLLDFKGGYSVEFRAFNDGIAYRFITNKKGMINVKNETLQVNFPGNYLLHMQQSGSFKTAYEEEYTHLYSKEWKSSASMALLPILIDTQKGSKILISETSLTDYPAVFLKSNGSNGMVSVFPKVPLEFGEDGDRSVKILKEADYIAQTSGKRNFPWRYFVISTEDSQLIENTMSYRLAEKNILEDTSWIKPGLASWEWWNGATPYGPDVNFVAGCNLDTYKYFIDFAANYGIPYIIMDEGWAMSTRDPYTPNPAVDVHELIRYGKEKNVGIVLWLTWLTVENNFGLFETFEKWGVKGVKIDFMDRSDQWMVNYYERVAREAAKHHLFVDFHGAFKPAGLEYKYPNVLSYEGVRGMEQMGGCRPDNPTLYYRNDECTRYITQVPQTWDETIALKAKAGEYVIVAKRKGDKWYIGGMTNNRQQERTFELDFDFLKEGQSYRMTSFEDGVNANRQAMDYRKKEYTLKKGDKIIVRLARNGGFASVIE